jgi:probable lipoprotein NlpC
MRSIMSEHRYSWMVLLLVVLFASCKSSSRIPKEEKAETRKLIKAARSYRGTPYLFGGMSKSGIDCSGLLVSSYREVGKKIPRSTAEQIKWGKAVKKEELIPGDWLFFAEKKGSKKVAHVGLVTEVNGDDDVQFIHSSTKLGVVEDNLYAPYYLILFLQARRPF